MTPRSNLAHSRLSDEVRPDGQRRAECSCEWQSAWCAGGPIEFFGVATADSEWRGHITGLRDRELVGSDAAQVLADVLESAAPGETWGDTAGRFQRARASAGGESTRAFMQRTDPVGHQQCRDAGRL